MEIHENCSAHLPRFVELNERWIREHFAIEAADETLAADPGSIVRRGGRVFTATIGDEVIGACALFHEAPGSYELARMAVDPRFQGRGIARALAERALGRARELGADRVFLLSNTKLGPAMGLYRSLGFGVVQEGPHPVYSRCNVVMERRLTPDGAGPP